MKNILEEVPEKLASNLFLLPVVLDGCTAKQMATRQKRQTDVGGGLDMLESDSSIICCAVKPH